MGTSSSTSKPSYTVNNDVKATHDVKATDKVRVNDQKKPVPGIRVLVVGCTGQGKSSICRLLTGDKTIPVSSKAVGCTFLAQPYTTASNITLVDTAGLNEGKRGTKPKAAAMKDLVSLVQSIEGGLSLILHVRKCKDKISEVDDLNYQLFYDIMCARQIPMVICLTHAEQFNPMDKWWNENKTAFTKDYKWQVAGAVSVCTIADEELPDMEDIVATALRKKKLMSKRALESAIAQYALPRPIPPAGGIRSSVQRVWRKLCGWFGKPQWAVDQRLWKILTDLEFTPIEIDEITRSL